MCTHIVLQIPSINIDSPLVLRFIIYNNDIYPALVLIEQLNAIDWIIYML